MSVKYGLEYLLKTFFVCECFGGGEKGKGGKDECQNSTENQLLNCLNKAMAVHNAYLSMISAKTLTTVL